MKRYPDISLYFVIGLAMAAVAVLAGCSASPSADMLKALAGDPNSICWTVATPWGNSLFDRNHGCPGNSAPAGTPIVVVTPGGAPSRVEVVRP